MLYSLSSYIFYIYIFSLYVFFFFFFNYTATTEIYTYCTLFPYTTLFRSSISTSIMPISTSSSTSRMRRSSAMVAPVRRLVERHRHRLGKLCDREGLRQEGDVGDVDRLAKLLFSIARHEQHWQARPLGAHRAHHRGAVHHRHHHVADHQIHHVHRLEPLEPFLTLPRRHDGITRPGQRTLRDRAPHILVLDEQDGACAPLALLRPGRGRRRRGRIAGRAVDGQIDGEAGAFARLAVGEDEARRLLDDTIDGRQA